MLGPAIVERMRLDMNRPVVLLSVPGLREKDVAIMRHLRALTAGGEISQLAPSFPCVTCPVQAAMTTGKPANRHGVVANGFYWRERRAVEMWTSPSECIGQPQIWDFLEQHNPDARSAVWFPLHSKGCETDFVCTPAPIHNPDGSESLWCYTRPTELYGTLRDKLGHFPLQHFWGPMAGIQGTNWIVDSAVYAAATYRPEFFYIYLPHLDYAAQRTGPESVEADQAVADLDEAIGRLAAGFASAYGQKPLWLVAGEYVITAVNHVTCPNRLLREAGLLSIRRADDGEHLDLAASKAFALVDHQHSHVFVADRDPQVIARVVDLFRGQPGIDDVLAGPRRETYQLDHARSGDVILISTPNSWQAYYWWLDDSQAPRFARTVDIHRKPGYDPLELCFDPATKSIPLNAALIKGSHGAPADDDSRQSVLLASEPCFFPGEKVSDTDVFYIVLKQLGIESIP
jgi:predicted AlkP superfamily pyrophosphatase or phosphodiesterase